MATVFRRKRREATTRSTFQVAERRHQRSTRGWSSGQRGSVVSIKGTVLYWPGCTEAVRIWCRQCKTCASRKITVPGRKAQLHTIPAGYPMQIISVDIMGPLPATQDGCKYVLVAADQFTRWVEVYPIKNQEAQTVPQKLVDEMF